MAGPGCRARRGVLPRPRAEGRPSLLRAAQAGGRHSSGDPGTGWGLDSSQDPFGTISQGHLQLSGRCPQSPTLEGVLSCGLTPIPHCMLWGPGPTLKPPLASVSPQVKWEKQTLSFEGETEVGYIALLVTRVASKRPSTGSVPRHTGWRAGRGPHLLLPSATWPFFSLSHRAHPSPVVASPPLCDCCSGGSRGVCQLQKGSDVYVPVRGDRLAGGREPVSTLEY